MRHQLKPNTYTICESTEQCKELFEWANNNGVMTYATCDNNETVLSFSDDFDLIADRQNSIQSLDKTYFFIPLPEFISRLKGEWVEGKTVTLSDKLMNELIYILQDEREVCGNSYAAEILSTIKEQLNNQ